MYLGVMQQRSPEGPWSRSLQYGAHMWKRGLASKDTPVKSTPGHESSKLPNPRSEGRYKIVHIKKARILGHAKIGK